MVVRLWTYPVCTLPCILNQLGFGSMFIANLQWISRTENMRASEFTVVSFVAIYGHFCYVV